MSEGSNVVKGRLKNDLRALTLFLAGGEGGTLGSGR